MNTRIVKLLSGAIVLFWTMGVGLSAAPAQVAGGRGGQPPVVTADPVAPVTPAEIIDAFSVALKEANEEQAKLDHAELEQTFGKVRARIGALPRRSCGLSVAWNRYTTRFADILARVSDAPDGLAAAERKHAMAGLQELDRLITTATRYSADVCSDDRELAELKRNTQRHREDARARLGRVADAICTSTASDLATLTALANHHRPPNAEVRHIYNAASVDLLDEIGRLKRSGTLCSSRTARSFVKGLPAIVVENYVPYRDPVGVKTVENAGTREQLLRLLDERGRNWLKTYTVPPVSASQGTGSR